MFDPERGYPAIVPFLAYRGPEAAVAWLESVLDLRLAICLRSADGRIRHAELLRADGVVIPIGRRPRAIHHFLSLRRRSVAEIRGVVCERTV